MSTLRHELFDSRIFFYLAITCSWFEQLIFGKPEVNLKLAQKVCYVSSFALIQHY